MTQAVNSVGTILSIGVTPVGKLSKIGAPDMSKGEIDVTTLDSTGGYKEFISDFRDGGTMSFEGLAIAGETGQVAMKTNFDGDDNATFTITAPDGSTIIFDGYVSKFKRGDAAVGQAIAFSGEIRVSGVVSFASVASTGCSAIAFTATGGGALTAESFVPVFAIAKLTYTDQYTTETAVKITATNATPNTTMELYVDGEYLEDLTTATPSSAVSMSAATSKLFEVVTWQTDKTPITYKLMITRIS